MLPPVLAETRQAFRLGLGQDRAASARRVLRIVEPERIVSAPPHWRDYLVRSWRTPVPPPAVLFPRTGPGDRAVAAMAGRGLGARYGARRRYLRRRSGPAEPDFRGRHPLAPPASRGDGLGPRSDDRLHRGHGPRAPAADRARQVCGSTDGRRSISTQGRGVRPAAETCNDHARQPLHRWDTVLFPGLLLARGGACVSGGRVRRLSAVGREARRFQHFLSDRRARLHRGRRQAGAGDRRVARRGRARQLVRAYFRCHGRRHPARRAGHRLFPCRGRGAGRLPPLPLQPRRGAGRGRFRGQHHAPGAARRTAQLRGARHRGRDRRGLGPAARPDPGDRRAGLGQVDPARRRHAPAAGARRRAHPVL